MSLMSDYDSDMMSNAALSKLMGAAAGRSTVMYAGTSSSSYYPHIYTAATDTRTTATEPKKEKKKMLDNVKGYVEKHKDILFTLGLIILIDHFLFKGALRARIQTSIEGVLKTVEDRFHKDVPSIAPTKEA